MFDEIYDHQTFSFYATGWSKQEMQKKNATHLEASAFIGIQM